MDLRSKMEQYEILKKHPLLYEYLPHTNWYNPKILMDMLNKYSTIYLKPNNKSRGIGIIRVKVVSNNGYEVSFEKTSKKINRKNLVLELEQIMIDTKKYIVQQGIDLATYHDHSFDMRIVLQKVYKTWRVTLTSAKVASSADAIITNVAQGATDYLLHDILQEYDQKQNPMTTFREIIDLAHQIANVLGNRLPIMITGLDLALDKSNKLWFIESNAKPACDKCKLVNDGLSVAKYEEAREIIKNSRKMNKTKGQNRTKYKF
ncbi:YheC/YheD family protein [Natronincola ferrireducens]|uniref:YheC/D like ATP-grasp n=1 Tax=Natronincola ferrireducens TaxID=393762 RepID=A0A1G9CS40_9FIRM|nr:YheC/YheD family protein [Natronincola ferrireducens]SDK54456.1 YheC/D like ATP-grasp [Natronincola ferrireducens]